MLPKLTVLGTTILIRDILRDVKATALSIAAGYVHTSGRYSAHFTTYINGRKYEIVCHDLGPREG